MHSIFLVVRGFFAGRFFQKLMPCCVTALLLLTLASLAWGCSKKGGAFAAPLRAEIARMAAGPAESGSVNLSKLRDAELVIMAAPYTSADTLLSEGKSLSIPPGAAQEMADIAAAQENHHIFVLKSGRLLEYAVLDGTASAAKPVLFFQPVNGQVEIKLKKQARDLRPIEILGPEPAP